MKVNFGRRTWEVPASCDTRKKVERWIFENGNVNSQDRSRILRSALFVNGVPKDDGYALSENDEVNLGYVQGAGGGCGSGGCCGTKNVMNVEEILQKKG